ncbi:hypothetical protein [Nocardia amamiensis]|uniref:hypothetical protein n=1 Tax=Nocardia amamiensis TaxID=404578 RepID=UPI0033D1B09B
MPLRTAAWAAIFTTAAVVTVTATAAADPETHPPHVAYHANIVDRSVITTLEHGVFALAGDRQSVVVRNSAGRELDTLPLTFSIDGQLLPIRYDISGDSRTLTMTPDTEGIRRNESNLIASPLENQLAMNDLINAVSIGTSLGSLIGTAIGAAVGIGVGFVLAGAACAVISLGCVVTVLPIIGLVGAVGGLAGLVLGGGPTAAYALYEYVTTLQAPPGGTKYAPHVQGRPGGVPAPADASHGQ